MSYETVMIMPIRSFWLMLGNINRISAERDMRSLSVATASRSTKDSNNQYRQSLVVEMGDVSRLEHTLDRDGLNDLKRMM